MNNDEPTLNTEANDIAGNRIDGPVGNTAARPGAPGSGMGIPGEPPASPPASLKGVPAPSQARAAAKAGAPAGDTVGSDGGAPAAQAADGATAVPDGAYGGNFSNSTQGSYRDQDRRENQDSDPNRGEFGAQDLGGTTHGGFGNQNRLADYEPRDSAEDRYYGGPGAAGSQDNAYRSYDGRDARPDAAGTQYGFELGQPVANTSGQAADAAPAGPGTPSGPGTDNTNQPGRADALSAHQNDNGSPVGPDRGFAVDYGQTSLRGEAPAPAGPAGVPRRNQDEDGQSSRGGYDNQGKAGGSEGRRQQEQAEGAQPAGTSEAPQDQRPASSLGYGDRGREEPNRTPDYQTGDERNGYVSANGGDVGQGMGSKGGSYNDAYDDSKPGSTAGSPAPGDQQLADLDRNYGTAAQKENRADAGENTEDHGAPRRNAGRDGEGDE